MLSPADKVATLHKSIEGLFEISMTLINLVIRLAPIAVACFMFNLAAIFGVDLLIKLSAFVGVVVLALATLVAGKEAGNEMLQSENRESMK